MRQLILGTLSEYQAMDKALSNGAKFTFDNIRLPLSCTVQRVSLEISKAESKYIVSMDKGIKANTNNLLFDRFIEQGEISFDSLEGMMTFFQSLEPLFAPAQMIDTTGDKAVVSSLTDKGDN